MRIHRLKGLAVMALCLSSVVGLAGGNSWHGTITAVEESSLTESSVVPRFGFSGRSMGETVGENLAKMGGLGIAGVVLVGNVGRSFGSEAGPEKIATKQVPCTRILFTLDNGEEGDLCLTNREMSSSFVVGARVVVEANSRAKISMSMENRID